MLRLIATFVLIYLVFRIVTAWIMPMVVRWYVNRYKKKYYRENPQAKKQQTPSPKGQPPTRTDQLGEYVDFEEVEEENDPTPNTQ